jgi:peptidyl-prolyl cis-trans isomerase C
MKNRLIAIATLFVAATVLSACGQQGYKDKSPAVATVNGTAITDLQYRHVLRAARGVAVAANPQERKQTIDQLVTGELLVQEAKKEKLDKDKDVYLAMHFAEQSILARAVIGKYLQAHPVTPQEIQARYNELKNAKEYKIAHILVTSQDEATKIIAELKAGKSFAALAKAKSIDVDSGKRGGQVGWIEKGGLAPELYDEAAKLKNGEVDPQPVHSQFGWHVIKREAERTAKLPPMNKAEPAIARQLQRERFDTLIADLKKKAKIKVMPEPKKAESSTPATSAPAAPAAPAATDKDKKTGSN